MSYRFDKLRVLVVDDSKPMRMLVRGLLGAMGVVHIAEAADGEQGFDKANTYEPDIIFTDWMMEPVDGLELIRRIRLDPASVNTFVPIIMMTGHSERERVIEAREAGMTEFLAKPLAPSALLARVVTVIDNPRPFVRTKTYFGPDRRRKFDTSYSGPERRTAAAAAAQPQKQQAQKAVLTEARDNMRKMMLAGSLPPSPQAVETMQRLAKARER